MNTRYIGQVAILIALAALGLGFRTELPGPKTADGARSALRQRPQSLSGKMDAGRARQVAEAYSKLPLRFETWDETRHHNVAPGFSPAHSGRRKSRQSGAPVKFVSRGPGYAAFFTPTEVVLALQQGPGPNEKNKAIIP